MKERIVINKTDQIFNIVAQLPTQLNPKDFEHEVEQVPESFADLQELCKDLKGLYKNYNIEVFDDAIFVLDSKLVLLKVYDDGEIKDSGSEVIAENRTPQQMWQIIKNLVDK